MTKEEILSGESDVLEFKRDVPEQSVKYIKTVVAFANAAQKTVQKTTQKTTQKMSEMERRILGVIKENSGFSRNEIAKALGNISPDGVKYHLSSLQKKGTLKRVGGRKEGYWEVLVDI